MRRQDECDAAQFRVTIVGLIPNLDTKGVYSMELRLPTSVLLQRNKRSEC